MPAKYRDYVFDMVNRCSSHPPILLVPTMVSHVRESFIGVRECFFGRWVLGWIEDTPAVVENLGEL